MPNATPLLPQVVPADAGGISQAVATLAAGGLVALPTETVYGLGADAANGEAVAAIYAAKERPVFNPLILHVADRAMAGRYACFGPLAERLAQTFWPGGLTLVLPRRAEAPVAGLVTAGLDTIAIRVPAHPVMQQVIAGLGRAIAAPSANPSGRLSPTRAAHVVAGLGARVPLVLDGGPCAAGVESTIIGVDGDRATLLREGAIPREALAALGIALAGVQPGEPVQAPGMLLSHYAPRLPIRMDAASARAGEFHIGFGAVQGDYNLSPEGDPVAAAAQLFAALHIAETSGCLAIAVAPIPEAGLGAAINDRLRRAVA